MVSNIDLLRKDSEPETANPADNNKKNNGQRSASVTSAQGAELDRTPERASLTKRLADSNKRASIAEDEPSSSSMSGILSRIMDHIEDTDRRHNDALSAINDRLDQLAHKVHTEKEDADDGQADPGDDLEAHVTGISQRLASAKQAQESLSPRAMFEEKLSQLTARLASGAANNEKSSIPLSGTDIREGMSRLETLHDEFAEAASDEAFEDGDLQFVDTSKPQKEADNIPLTEISPEKSPMEDIEEIEIEPQSPLHSAASAPAQPKRTLDDISQTFEDEISSASLPIEPVDTIQPATETGDSPLNPYETEEDAMEALVMGFEEQNLAQNPYQSENNTDKQAPFNGSNNYPVSQTTKSDAPSAPYGELTPTSKALDIKHGEDIGPRMDRLVAKFEDILNARNTEPLIRTIEAQIAELPDYLGREELRQQRLEHIETNIASLTAMIQDTKTAIAELSERIAEETATHVVNKLDWGTSADRLAAIDDYLHSLKENEQEQEERTTDTLEAVYDALEQMIGRLEAMETVPSEAVATPLVELPPAAAPIPSSNASFFNKLKTEKSSPLVNDRAAPRNPFTREVPSSAAAQNDDRNLSDDHEDETDADAADETIISQRADDALTSRTGAEFQNSFAEETDEIDDDEEEATRNEFVAAAQRRAKIASEDTSERWDRHVPPYIAASHARERRPKSYSWARKNKTALIAASMVFLSASAGLLLSQLPVFNSTENPVNQANNPTAPADIALRNNAVPSTGAIGAAKPAPQTTSPSLRTAQERQYGQDPAAANGQVQNTAPVNLNGYQYPSYNQQNAETNAPTAKQSKQENIEVLPGVAIGHVSEKTVRQQLHQSVRQQQIAELSGKPTQQLPSDFPQAMQPPTQQPSQQAAPANPPIPLPQQAALKTVDPLKPDPSTSASHRTLPPPEVGPMSLRVGAANGDPKAEYEVGARYARGLGVTQDLAQAADWFQRAASTGYAPAQYRLATHFERGAGVQKDVERAKIWYRRAAEAGNVKAMHNYAVLHTGREGIKADYGLATKWFTKAANHGLADSQYNLAILYENGLGVARNLIEAYKWLTLASLSGDAEAGKRRDILRTQLEPSAIATAERAALEWKAIPPAESANAEVPGAKMLQKASAPDNGGSSETSANSGTAGTMSTTSSIAAMTPSATPKSDLQEGVSTKPDPLVRKAQELLSKLGYDTGPADGQVGPKTRSAIIAFERRAGMQITGDVSIELIQRLSSLSI